MIPESFKRYYDSRVEGIKKDFINAFRYHTIDGIHDFRVDIKRLRAFFDLIGWIDPFFDSRRNFREIRRIFKSAGKVRDVHVQQELVRNNYTKASLNLNEYVNYLKQKEMAARAVFRSFAVKFDFNRFGAAWILIEGSLGNIDIDYIKYKTEQRLHNCIKELVDFKDKTALSGDDHHKIRILAKEARYTLEILESSFPVKEFVETLDDDLRDLHRALGKWHDCQVGLIYLERFIEKDAHHPLMDSNSYKEYSNLLKSQAAANLDGFEKKWSEFRKLLRLHDFEPLDNTNLLAKD